MRISKWIKPLCFLLVVCLCNMGMSFLFLPAMGSSKTMWEEYYREEEIDMVFIGSSLCSASFNPQIIDELLGVKSFNTGTPMQGIKQHITAIETVLEDHEIDTIVIALGFFALQIEDEEAVELTFQRALAKQKGGLKGISHEWKYVLSEDVRGTEASINYWFPWMYDKESYTWDIISKNVQSKIRLWNENEVSESTKGYRPYEGVMVEGEYSSSAQMYKQDIEYEQVDKLKKLLAICEESGADVIVVNTPHPTFDIISCAETYGDNTELVQSLCEKYNVDYYDFSLAKPELFDAKEEYYYNFEHLNGTGAEVFCNVFCDLMQKRATGENVEDYFYSVKEFFEIMQ